MVEVEKYSIAGEKIGKVILPDSLFAIESENADTIIQEVIVMYLANQRQGSSSVKFRSDIIGSGKKIYKQKGTGNARFGDKKIVSRRGGGRSFGPMPKDWTKKIPKKKKKLALKLILTNLVKNTQVIVLENFSFEKPSTKKAKETISKIAKGKKPLLVIEDSNINIVKSFSNLSNVKTERADSIYPYGLLNTDCLIITENALEKITEVFAS